MVAARAARNGITRPGGTTALGCCRALIASTVALDLAKAIVDFAFTAVFKKVPEGYIAFVEELPGANTQGATLDEARENLREAVQLVIDANRELAREDAGDDVIRESLRIANG
jgi:predicted RNase H-like HicB family nuclease